MKVIINVCVWEHWSCTRAAPIAFPHTGQVRIKCSLTCWGSCTFMVVHTEGSSEPTIQPLPGQSQLMHMPGTPDCAQLEIVSSVIGHTTVCTNDRQLWFYSLNLLVTFSVPPNFLQWNKLHYLGFKMFWLLQLRRLPDAFTCFVFSQIQMTQMYILATFLCAKTLFESVNW